MPCLSSRTRVWRVSSQRTTSAAASSASTRRVTSSRFPIGVAQTASGTGPQPSAASKPTKAAPMRPAAVPSSALTRRTVLRIGSSASRRMTSCAGPSR